MPDCSQNLDSHNTSRLLQACTISKIGLQSILPHHGLKVEENRVENSDIDLNLQNTLKVNQNLIFPKKISCLILRRQCELELHILRTSSIHYRYPPYCRSPPKNKSDTILEIAPGDAPTLRIAILAHYDATSMILSRFGGSRGHPRSPKPKFRFPLGFSYGNPYRLPIVFQLDFRDFWL